MLRHSIAALALFTAIFGTASNASAQALVLPFAGGQSTGFGGATTAAPLDAGSALQWNPAAISGVKQSEVLLGGAVLFPEIYLSSQIRNPLNGRINSGFTRSDSGAPLTSTAAFVYKIEDSPITVGMGMGIVAAGGVNFPGDATNPILAPTGPLRQFQFGPIAATSTFIQITPTVSYQVTEKLALGVGPVVNMGLMSLSPAYFGGVDNTLGNGTIRGDGLLSFPAATNTQPSWGGGFRAGAYYHATENLDVGFGYTSKQWFDTFRFNSNRQDGTALPLTLDVNLPAIYSLGFAYKGIEKWLFSVDVRYLDYADTATFGTPNDQGGMGWKSIYAVALGAQYQASERFAVRAGYIYNQNPISSDETLFNMQAPLINQHTVTAGFTYQVTESISTSLAYACALPSTLQGTVLQSRGTGVQLDSMVNMVAFGMNFAIGSPAKPATRIEYVEPAPVVGSPTATPAPR
jgi:long-chain fatty acid transport protein